MVRGEVGDKTECAEGGRAENWESYGAFIFVLHSSLTNIATTLPLDIAT